MEALPFKFVLNKADEVVVTTGEEWAVIGPKEPVCREMLRFLAEAGFDGSCLLRPALAATPAEQVVHPYSYPGSVPLTGGSDGS